MHRYAASSEMHFPLFFEIEQDKDAIAQTAVDTSRSKRRVQLQFLMWMFPLSLLQEMVILRIILSIVNNLDC